MSILADNFDKSSLSSSSSSAGRPLGTIARISSGASGRHEFSAVVRRYVMQAAARDLLPRERVALCLRRPIPSRGFVDVIYTPVGSSSCFGGLQVCSSVWMCPLCAAKISERRREELSLGVRNWYDFNNSARILLVTFTLSHNQSDTLTKVLSSLKKARSLLVSGRWASAFSKQYNIQGYVRSLEVTYGDNGFHPHLHVLYFFNQEVPIIPFENAIKQRWLECVQASGSYASWQYGCDVRYSDKEITNYITKFGKEPEWLEGNKILSDSKWSLAHEVTKGVTKVARSDGGATPLQLLYDYAYNNDKAAGDLWRRYALSFKGERQLYYSQGMRYLMGLKQIKTDEEIAMEHSEFGVILAELTLEQWRVVLGQDARAELLQAAASGDRDIVWVFLGSIGVDHMKLGG